MKTVSRQAAPVGGRLYGVQVARALAAVSVLTGHSLHEAALVYHKSPSSELPWMAGVDLFFVISGFIIVFTSQSLFSCDGGSFTFLKRRLTRVAPLYWFYTALMILALLVFKNQMHTARFNIMQIIYSITFFPGFVRPDGEISPVLSLGWSLNYEIFFYICFAPLIVFPRVWAIRILTIFFLGLALSSVWIPYTWTSLRFWTKPIILEFVAGAALGSLYLDGFRIERRLATILSLVGLLMLGVQPLVNLKIGRALAFGGPAIAIFCALGMARGDGNTKTWPNILIWLGNLSFSLYLSHPFILAILAMIWESLGANKMAPEWSYCVVAIALSILGSYLSFVAVERPLMRLFKRDRVAAAPTSGA